MSLNPVHSLFDNPAFEALFSQSSEAVLLLSAGDSPTVTMANPVAADLLGFDARTLVGMPVAELIAEGDLTEALEFLDTIKNRHGAAKRACAMRPADGFCFPAELVAQKIAGADNKVFLLLTFQDLTERIRASEDIALRNIAIANVHSGVTIADARQPDLPLIYVNRGFQEMTGYSAKEAVGRSCRFLQGADRKQPQLEALRSALRNGDACVVRLRNYRKDGSLFFNELHISPVRNEFGELTHFVGIQIDVTERERARERLTLSESRYRMLANTVDDLIIRRDPNDLIEFSSSASTRMIGVDPEDLVGRNLKSYIHPEDRATVVAQMKRILLSEGPRTVTFRMRLANGTYRWFESRDRLMTESSEGDDTTESLIVSVIRDVTLRKRAEEETRKALQKEKEINEMKTAFISMVSHEFRTPMTGIQSSSSLLRKFGEKLGPEKRERHLANIESALKRMNRLLDDVLFFSRAEANKLKVQRAPLSLQAYLAELVEGLSLIYPEHEVRVELETPKNQPYPLDSHLLSHILQNLIGNALKYSAQDAPVFLNLRDADDTLVFTITDSGIGIPEVDQARLFEAFHRAQNVGTIQGTGIGLNIAQRAVELLGGSIRFHSQQGSGSVFTVTLPLLHD